MELTAQSGRPQFKCSHPKRIFVDEMKVRNLEVSDTGNELICNGLLITEIEAFDQLVNLVDEYAEKFPKNSEKLYQQ